MGIWGGDTEQRPKWSEELCESLGGKVTSGGIPSAKAPNRNNLTPFYEEQVLWITVRRAVGYKVRGRAFSQCLGGHGTNSGFYSKCEGKSCGVKGSHASLEVRIVTRSNLHSKKYSSCSVYVWLFGGGDMNNDIGNLLFFIIFLLLLCSLQSCFMEWVEITSYKVCHFITRDVLFDWGGSVAASKQFYIRLPQIQNLCSSWLKYFQ